MLTDTFNGRPFILLSTTWENWGGGGRGSGANLRQFSENESHFLAIGGYINLTFIRHTGNYVRL